MNTSSRMMSFGDEQCIHISGGVKAELPNTYSCKVIMKMCEKCLKKLLLGPWKDHR